MRYSVKRIRITGILLTCACVLIGAPPANSQDMHQHMQAGSAVGQITLDDGSQWQTDASLRSGMAAIRAAFDAHHPAIHAGQETDSQYDALAEQVETQVDGIVQNCHLPAAADANLHYVIADLLQGVSLMRGTDPARSRHDGAALVHGALIAYGENFDDPAWASISSSPRTP